MKMPKGLDKLEQDIECRSIGKRDIFYLRGMIALDIMKEMAEALEKYASDSFDSTSGADFDEDGYGKSAREALKKFKEWK